MDIIVDKAASMVLFNKLVTEPNKQGQLEGLMGLVMGGVNVAFGTGKALYDFKKAPRNTQPFSKASGKNAYINEWLTASNDSDRIKVNNGGVTNGIDNGRTLSENDERHSEVQVGESGETIQNRRADGQHTEPSQRVDTIRYRNTSRRIEQVETGKLDDVIEQKNFTQLAKTVGNSISKLEFPHIWEKYLNDKRFNNYYDFSDVVTYDMLTSVDNDLRPLFADEIAEYFNQNNSTNVDTTGKVIPERVLKKTEKSVVRNANGQLIPLYHATDKEFDKFEIGDIGFHFGSYSQAHRLAESKGILENAKFVKAYLDIKKPLVMITICGMQHIS